MRRCAVWRAALAGGAMLAGLTGPLCGPARAEEGATGRRVGKPHPLPLMESLLRYSDAVVEARAGELDFVVVRSLAGSLKPGERLPFERCAQIQRGPSSADALTGLARLPLLNSPAGDAQQASADRHAELERAPPSQVSPDARWLLLIRLQPDGRWEFARQTEGDLFLIQDERVYQLEWVKDRGRVWSVYPLASAAASFFQLVEQLLAKELEPVRQEDR